jgi:hypothetical protein
VELTGDPRADGSALTARARCGSPCPVAHSPVAVESPARRYEIGEQAHVVSAVAGHPLASQLEHLLGFVDPHDRPRGAHLARQQRQAQSRAAAHVEDRVTAPGRQLVDQQFTPVAKGAGALLVAAGLAALGLASRLGAARRCGLLCYGVGGST